MATKGYRQPFGLKRLGTSDDEPVAVLSYHTTPRTLEWVAPDMAQAAEYADIATAEWQMNTYGHVDRRTHHAKHAAAWGYPVGQPSLPTC